jgi:hypothetical protein
MSFSKTFMIILLAVTAVVTPLGLYEGFVAEQAEEDAVFHYIRDTTPMGYGTPPRADIAWSRICGWWGSMPCPNDNNEATIIDNGTLFQTNFTRDWYDSRIPQRVIDVFQSGTLDFEDTVSGPFDIQYRSYVKSVIDDIKGRGRGLSIDNGTARAVGTYQPLSSLVLSDAILPVEGLIVDMKNGGVGFRNHSAPTFRPFGSAWTEDTLFVVPETVCVDTNLTLDFLIARTRTEELLTGTNGILRPEIVDHGGFINFNKSYPDSRSDDVLADPNLWYRAYKAAWNQNFFSMVFMNVITKANRTTEANGTTGIGAGPDINSNLGKTFPLYFPDGKSAAFYYKKPNSLSIAATWGEFLEGTEDTLNQSRYRNTTFITPTAGIYSNPYGISASNWSSISKFAPLVLVVKSSRRSSSPIARSREERYWDYSYFAHIPPLN